MRPVSDLQRKVSPFQVISDYVPAGDQPVAIEEIARRINDGVQDVVLLGATGTGKSATTKYQLPDTQACQCYSVDSKDGRTAPQA